MLAKLVQIAQNSDMFSFASSGSRTTDSLKRKGNEFFVKKQYSSALKCYTEGLELSPNDIDVLSNRCQTYIFLRRFILAQKDADAVLVINPSHSKAIYRKTKALCGQHKYAEAQAFLSEAIKRKGLDNIADLKNLMKDVETLNQQSETGNYDLKIIQTRSNQGGISEFYNDDLAQFIGPVKVVECSGKGKGLVATEYVKSGQVVVACKAFHLLTENYDTRRMYLKDAAKFATDHDPVSKKFSNRTDGAKIFIQSIIERLREEPEMLQEIYKLYAGGQYESSRERSGKDQSTGEGEILFDETRIARICDYNFFCINDMTGIWLQPSYINHSCVEPNCFWINAGDLMLVRCCKNVAKGEELVMGYVGMEKFHRREESLSQYAFNCQCRLCAVERSEDSKLLWKRRLSIDNCYLKNTIRAYEDTLDMLREMNKGKDAVLNVLLITPAIKLSDLYFANEEYQKTIDILKEVYPILQRFIPAPFKMNSKNRK